MDWRKNLNTMLANAMGSEQAGQSTEMHEQEQINQFFSLVAKAF